MQIFYVILYILNYIDKAMDHVKWTDNTRRVYIASDEKLYCIIIDHFDNNVLYSILKVTKKYSIMKITNFRGLLGRARSLRIVLWSFQHQNPVEYDGSKFCRISRYILTSWFLRWIISRNNVGLSSTGFVKICSKYPLSSKSTKMWSFSICMQDSI